MENQQTKRITQHIMDRYGCEPEHLWAKYPGYAVFRHPASRKWYAVTMSIPRDKLGLTGDSAADVINVKCSPLMIGSLLQENGFFPAYHMNKNHWVSILLDDSISNETVFSLLELSYDSIAPKRKKKAD